MRKKYLIPLFITIGLVVTLAFNNVSQNITKEDQNAIRKIISKHTNVDLEKLKRDGFKNQIETIRIVQDAILKQTPQQQIIPLGQTREPTDLSERNYALCGDRSRFMHKAFRILGFETRFASLYDSSKVDSNLEAILTTDKSKVRSHALIEVKTDKGWMMVDSVTRWIALTENGDVYDLEFWQDHPAKDTVNWDPTQKGEIYYLLNDQYTYIYGLYSRHGKFYPPFTPFPDVNLRELLHNF